MSGPEATSRPKAFWGAQDSGIEVRRPHAAPRKSRGSTGKGLLCLVPKVGLHDCKLGMLNRDVVYVGHQVAAWTLPAPFVLRLGPQRDSTIERVCADLPDVLIPPRPARP